MWCIYSYKYLIIVKKFSNILLAINYYFVMSKKRKSPRVTMYLIAVAYFSQFSGKGPNFFNRM